MTTRDDIVNAARAELGTRSPAKYWLDVLVPADPAPKDATGKPLSWCGAFALWCLRAAGACDWRWRFGVGFAYRLPVTDDPLPGDVAYIDRPLQHQALVEWVDDEWVTTIDGNSIGMVRRNMRKRSAFTAFYSVAGLVDAPVPVVNQ